MTLNNSCLAIERWASENKYRYMSTFLKWVKATHFCPVSEVIVEADVVGAEGPLAGFSECTFWQEKLRKSKILDVVASVNWGEIHRFNLETIVSLDCMLQLHDECSIR